LLTQLHDVRVCKTRFELGIDAGGQAGIRTGLAFHNLLAACWPIRRSSTSIRLDCSRTPDLAVNPHQAPVQAIDGRFQFAL
jgi:hypothetical protein